MAKAEGAANAVQFKAYWDDVTWWRAAGVAVYAAVPLVPLNALMLSHAGGNGVITSIASTALALGPLGILLKSQSAVSSAPAAIDRCVPVVTRHIPADFLQSVGYVLGRFTDKRLGANAIAFTVAQMLTATMLLWIFYGFQISFHQIVASGVVLGFGFVSTVFGRNQDILQFPIVQRHRLLRLKSRILPAFGFSLAALLVSLALWFSQTIPRTLLMAYASIRSVRFEGMGTGSNFALPLLGSIAYVLGQSIGLEVYRIVCTEKLSFENPSGDSLLQPGLNNEQDSGPQVAAFAKLVAVSKGQGSSSMARRIIFADNSGELWKPPANACIQELEIATSILAQGLPQSSSAQPSNGSKKEAPSWNRPAAGSQANLTLPASTSGQAASLIEARFQKLSFALTALSNFCSASKQEDHFGVLQLGEPSLGSILLVMLSLWQVTSHHLRNSSRSNKSRGDLCGNVAALEDLLQTSLLRLVDDFGEDLLAVIEASKHRVQYSSKIELAKMLEQMLRGAS